MNRPGRTRVHVALGLLMAGLALGWAGPGAGARAAQTGPNSGREDFRERLDRIRERMAEGKAELGRLKARQGQVAADRERLSQAWRRSRETLDHLFAEKAILDLEAEDLARQLQDLKARIDAERAAMDQRLRARYRFGKAGILAALFGSQNLGELSRRRKYLEAVFASDAGRIAERKALVEQWRLAGRRLQARRAALGRLEPELALERDELDEQRRSLGIELSKMGEQRKLRELEVADLGESARRLEAALVEIGRLGPDQDLSAETRLALSGASFAESRGRLPAPADGPILSGFGEKIHPEYQTVIVQNGIELQTRPGAPVRAVAGGVVRFADWFKGYGALVILDHGQGYYTVYARLGAIGVKAGAPIEAGAALGSAGDDPLYFEVRKKDRALDPANWLAP